MVKIKKAVVLLRSANESQQHQSESLLTQLAAIADYAEQFKIKIEKIIDNKQTTVADNATSNRQMDEALVFFKDNPDVKYLLVTDTTRVSRDYNEYIKWKTLLSTVGVRIVSVKQFEQDDNTASVQLMKDLMRALSQYDSSRHVESVRRGLRRKKEQETSR